MVSHVKGANNRVADMLSRWHWTQDNIGKLNNIIESPVWMDVQTGLTLLNHDI